MHVHWQFDFFPRAAASRAPSLHRIEASRGAGCNVAPHFSPAGDRAFGVRRPCLHRFGSISEVLATVFFLVLPLFAGRFARASQAAPPAQSENGSATLASIQIVGSKRFTSAQIAPATGLKVGSQITRADLQQAANVLAQLGPFRNVQYRYATEAAGVVLQFQVADAPAVPVFFDNFPWFTDEQLDAAIKQSTPLYDGMAPEHGTLLDSMANSLGLFLVAHGYPGTVSHALTSRVFSDQKVQEFKIDNAGINFSNITFTDPLAQNDRGIRTRLTDLIGKPYSRTAIELFELEQVRPVYLAHAYDRVQFQPPKPQVDAPDRSRVSVTVPIDPGPAYTWAGVTWTGATAISTSDLNSMVKLVSGESANGMTIEATWQAVEDAFTNLGYLDVTLTPTPHYDDVTKHVSYTVAIDQGPQYRMGRLILSGLSVEGERRIRGAWQIQPGQIFDKGTYDEFLAHGIDKAFAGFPAHYDKIGRYLQKNSKSDTVDVMMDFE
jgi:outer membrane protein assembly factor BamA